MNNKHAIVRYVTAALLVMMLGGLAGWYFFVRGQIAATQEQDNARGFGVDVREGGGTGSAISNLSGATSGADPTRAAEKKGLWTRVVEFFSGRGEGGGVSGFADSFGGLLSGVTGGGEGVPAPDTSAPKLWHITRTPVAGHGFATSSAQLYFAERASGNVLTANPANSKIERITNTLFPKIIEAVFAADGSVVLRSMSDSGEALTFLGSIATSSNPAAGDTPNKLEGVALPQGVVSIAGRSSPKELFFVLETADGGSIGMTADWRGGNQKRVLVSALSDWSAMLMADGTKYVVQKPADGMGGHAFRVLEGGSLERVLSDIAGLMILPRTNTGALLYSDFGGRSAALYARTGAQAAFVQTPVKTTADKCVWTQGATLVAYCAVPLSQNMPSLSERFDGSGTTADAWWRLDISANTAERIYTPEPVEIDVENPQIDASGRYISFMNAKDKTLWMLSLDK